MSLVLRPVHGFPMRPGWSWLHRLLQPVCPICPVASQARLPMMGRNRGFLGSCLVTGLGLGWLPNAFSLTGSLRTGFFVFAGTRTFRTFAPVSSLSYAQRFTVLLAQQTTCASRGLVTSRLRQLPANCSGPIKLDTMLRVESLLRNEVQKWYNAGSSVPSSRQRSCWK